MLPHIDDVRYEMKQGRSHYSVRYNFQNQFFQEHIIMIKPYASVRGVGANECAHLQALESNAHVD